MRWFERKTQRRSQLAPGSRVSYGIPGRCILPAMYLTPGLLMRAKLGDYSGYYPSNNLSCSEKLRTIQQAQSTVHAYAASTA